VDLLKVIEDVAMREISNNPSAFIRRESKAQMSKLRQGGDDEFHSADDAIEEEDDEESKFENTIDYYNQQERPPQISSDDANGNSDLDDVFHDALDCYHQSVHTPAAGLAYSTTKANKAYDDEDDDPPERHTLPYLKDPNVKISIWTIIKDSIGKDLTKISVPVYFNDPHSILQKSAQTMEYNHLLDQAINCTDSMERLKKVVAHSISCWTHMQTNNTKPFNPMLGETYEFLSDDFRFFSEQVSHHPPISAFLAEGKSGYQIASHSLTKSKFSGKTINFQQCGKIYYTLKPWNEVYESGKPTMSAHNLILGTPYIELSGKFNVTNTSTGEYATLEWHRRGWTASSAYHVDGAIHDRNGKVRYKLNGKWSDQVTLTSVDTNQEEVIWKKNPMPENYQFLYGYSHFSLQLNYFPKRLQSVVPPTDTRRRPDQRALENGDLKLATSEKNRLEEKQRAVRKWREEKGIEWTPVFFDEEKKSDGEQVFHYKGGYWEQRARRDWHNLPDLFSEELPEEMR